MLIVEDDCANAYAVNFCREFIESARPKYIFGRNAYAKSIAQCVSVEGYIDDFTKDKFFNDKPVYRTEDIGENSLVVSAALMRPLTAKKRLDRAGVENLDYFSFQKYSGLNVMPANWWNVFPKNFCEHREKYADIYQRLADKESRLTFSNIVNFRLSGNLRFMECYEDRQDKQYFEPFLHLRELGEVFIDVGGHDGYTSETFIKRCASYQAIHLFEPHEKNMLMARKRLSVHPHIHFYPIGLFDKKTTLRFSYGDTSSASKISERGTETIKVDALDAILQEPPTFIKMDIEGGERAALKGCRQIIETHHPRLAICVYHQVDDFWKIPEQVHSYRQDYTLYLRHYTEGTDETVMFFIPEQKV